MNNLVHIYIYIVGVYLHHKFLEIGLLGQRINACVVLLDIAEFLSISGVLFHIHTSNVWK